MNWSALRAAVFPGFTRREDFRRGPAPNKAKTAAAIAAAVLALLGAGRFLSVDRPERSDLILVLEGESETRPALGVRLLEEGWGRCLWIDADARLVEYNRTEAELAEAYVGGLGAGVRAHTAVNAETAESTKLEAEEAGERLAGSGVRSVLVITSEYHTRRALTIFRHEIPGVRFSVAGAVNSREFGRAWWRHRQWAKHTVIEMLSFVWYEAVDRWLPGHPAAAGPLPCT